MSDEKSSKDKSSVVEISTEAMEAEQMAETMDDNDEEETADEEEDMNYTPESGDSKNTSFSTDKSNESSSNDESEKEETDFITEPLRSLMGIYTEHFSGKSKKNRQKCAHNSRTEITETDDQNMVDSETGSSDDSDSNILQINQSDNEDDDKDLDHKLDEDALKNNLTTTNVKNILHHVITNKDVVDMVKNTLATEITQDPQLFGQTFEPKMTRSKMKEVIEKGNMPQVWPLTPVKKKSKSKPSFLDMQFTDDEDDEYEPDMDKDALLHDSDDETASLLSSQASEFGSPYPPTPTTPAHHLIQPVDVFVSPMVPVKCSVKADLGQAFNQVSSSSSDENFLDMEIGNDTIARRTRSKLPLTSTSLLELESTFVAPDITEDMYDTLCDDSEWQQFLSSLIKTDVTPVDAPEIHDDETNDPEYDYLGEAEHEEKDEEDYRFGRPYRIPKKEMFDLLSQLTEFMASDQEDDDEHKNDTGGESIESDDNKKIKEPSIEGLEFTTSQLLILQDQMRKHVQLSTQLYFLCLGSDDYSSMTTECVKHLHELDMFRQTSLASDRSSFNVCNLTRSLELVREERNWNLSEELEDIESQSFDDVISNATDSDDGIGCDTTAKKIKAKSKVLLESQKHVFFNSLVFFYPGLLPKRRLLSKQDAKELRVFFTSGEDKLIVLGMDQFGTTPKNYSLIQKYLLPAKTVKQINFRVKNLSSNRTPDNPIKLYKKNKMLPENAALFNIFDPSSMMAPTYQDIDLLPKWCKKYREEMEDEVLKKKEDTTINDDRTSDDSDDEYSKSKKSGKKKRRPRAFKTSSNKKTGSNIPSNPSTPNPTSPGMPGTPIPTALITSAGLYVPIRFASPSTLPPNLQSAIFNFSPCNPSSLQQQIVTVGTTPDQIDDTSPLRSNYFNTLTPDYTSQSSPCPVVNSEPSEPSQTISLVADSTSQVTSVVADSTQLNTTDMVTEQTNCCTTEQTHLIHHNVLDSHAAVTSDETGSIDEKKISNSIQTCEASVSMMVAPVNQASMNTANPMLSSEVSTAIQLPLLEEPIHKDTVNPESVSAKPVLESKTIIAVSQNNLSGIVITTPVPSPLNMEVINSFTTDMSNSPATSRPENMQTTPPKHVSNQSVNSPADTTGSFLSTPASLASSNTSSLATPKTAVEIMAALAPFYNSYLATPAVSQQAQLETTPTKKYKYRELAPKPINSNLSSKSLYLSPKKKNSPNIAMLKRQARSILPKGFVHEPCKISPTKRAANQIKKRAQKMYQKGLSPNKLLLPKLPVFTEFPLYHNTQDQTSQKEDMCVGDIDYNINNSAIDGSKVVRRPKRRISENEKMEESDDHHSEVEDVVSQDESQPEDDLEDGQTDDQDHLDELMAASTTIRFDPRKSSNQITDTKTKTQKRKELNISILAGDILQSDPKRDDRDTAFAQAYMHQVQETLLHDTETYERFLRLMCEFGKGNHSPIQLYKDLCDLLKNYPDLIEDFSGFLRPDEAVECGCFTVNQEYQRANEFLRKIEINFEKQPTQFQRILRAFDKWRKIPNRTGEQIKTQIRALLKGASILLQEFDMFFPEEKIPDSHAADFEEVNLSDSDFEDESNFDGFEEVEVPEEFDTYRTKRCKCDCHCDPNDTKLQARLKHCYDCSLKNIDGGLYFQTSRNKLQPVRVVFHKLPDSPSPPQSKTPEELVADKENMNNELSPPLSAVIQQTSTSPLKHCSLKKAKKMKLKTDKKKPGQKRFLSLNEITSPIKANTSSDSIKTDTLTQSSTDISNLNSFSAACEMRLSNVITTSITCTATGTTLLSNSSTLQVCQSNNDSMTGTIISIPDQSFINEDCNHSLSTFLNTNKVPSFTINQESCKPWAIMNANSVDIEAKTSKKCETPSFLNPNSQMASKSWTTLNENSTTDILSKALKFADIGKGDISVDSVFYRGFMNSPAKSQGESRSVQQPPSSSVNQLSFSGTIQPINSSSLFSATNSVNSTPLFLNSSSTTLPVLATSQFEPAFSLSSNMTTVNVASSGDKQSKIFSETSEYLKLSESTNSINIQAGTMVMNTQIEDVVCTWTREMDKIILELCQAHGANEETFTVISQKLVNKTMFEVSERFRTLMELLSDSHGESDEDMSE